MSFKKDGKDKEKQSLMQAQKSLNDRGGNMKCMHLKTVSAVSCCKASERPYVPSLFELVEYCRKRDHRKCPFYLRGIVAAGRLESDSPVLA